MFDKRNIKFYLYSSMLLLILLPGCASVDRTVTVSEIIEVNKQPVICYEGISNRVIEDAAIYALQKLSLNSETIIKIELRPDEIESVREIWFSRKVQCFDFGDLLMVSGRQPFDEAFPQAEIENCTRFRFDEHVDRPLPGAQPDSDDSGQAATVSIMAGINTFENSSGKIRVTFDIVCDGTIINEDDFLPQMIQDYIDYVEDHSP